MQKLYFLNLLCTLLNDKTSSAFWIFAPNFLNNTKFCTNLYYSALKSQKRCTEQSCVGVLKSVILHYDFNVPVTLLSCQQMSRREVIIIMHMERLLCAKMHKLVYLMSKSYMRTHTQNHCYHKQRSTLSTLLSECFSLTELANTAQ